MVKTTYNEDIEDKDLVKLVEKREWLKTQLKSDNHHEIEDATRNA